MNQHSLPDLVVRFVLAHIHSVEQLEVLLLLRKCPDQSWRAEAIAAALRANPLSIQTRLADLRVRRLVAQTRDESGDVSYRYAPAPELAEAVDTLARFYATHNMRVIELIYSRPVESIRSFADAFRFRKDEEEW